MNPKLKHTAAIITLLIIAGIVVYHSVFGNKVGEDVVAVVNGYEITARELILNYEFGFPHIKKGETQKERLENYLDLMIAERIIAEEGRKAGLHKNSSIKEYQEELEKELLLEAVVEKDIESKVNVTTQEIEEAINRSKVSFKLRFWVEPNYKRALEVKEKMDKEGYAEVVTSILVHNPELNFDPRYLETDYLTWLEVTPEVLSAIQNIPAGQISEPLLINNYYFLIQVADIRRNSILAGEYKSQAPSIKKVLHHAKLQSEIVNYVDSLMTPLNIVTKGKQFRLLADALAEWKADSLASESGFEDYLYTGEEYGSKVSALRKSLNDTLIYYDGGGFTIGAFLELFDPAVIKNSPANKRLFRSELNNNIAITLRNHFMIKEGLKKGYEKSDWFAGEVNSWATKWTYEEMLNKWIDEFKPGVSEMMLAGTERRDYQQEAKSYVNHKLDSLKQISNIKIYTGVLDTLTVNEFDKSRWAGLQVYKGGTGRLAVPVVDPSWGIYIN